jgi:S-adenosylmethionine decarboxylase
MTVFNEHMKEKNYGTEVIIDLFDCDEKLFTKEILIEFVQLLIKKANMQAHGEPVIWEDHNSEEPHMRGISIFQWISTSNIVIHSLTLTKLVLINMFSCKDFDAEYIAKFCKDFFGSKKMNFSVIKRGETAEQKQPAV